MSALPISELFGGGQSVIKSIQRGTISVGTQDYFAEVTVSQVDMSKSVLNHLGGDLHSSGGSGSLGSIRLTLVSVDKVRASHVAMSGYGTTQTVSFELVEYR